MVLLEQSPQKTPPHFLQCCHRQDTVSTEQLSLTTGSDLTCLRSQMEKGFRHMKVSQWAAWESGCTRRRTCQSRARCGYNLEIGGSEMEHTFQSRLGRRTARCSFCLGRGMEPEASVEHEGSDLHERESNEELMEEAPREWAASVAREGR